jgi:hypothetical protein
MFARRAGRGPRVCNRIRGGAVALFAMLLAILASAALLIPDQAKAQARNTVSAITVDVAPLRARGVGVFADLLHDSLRAELQARYTITADAPRLHVTLNSFFLNSRTSIDRDDSFGGGFAQPPLDNLGGEAQLITLGGRVIDSYSLLANNPATTAAHRRSPEREQIRARALTEVFAGWVARRF